ncbi:hypothetical protein DFH06DRAFT_1328471 [Mycena polygramma]|nr:hypothetical protein DFH06DRAFT_1328471 [Mycena polygramma]
MSFRPEYKYKDQNARGIRDISRFLTKLDVIENHSKHAAATYRTSYKAMSILGERLGRWEWARMLRVLKVDDVRQMLEAVFRKPGTKPQKEIHKVRNKRKLAARGISWIWLADGSAADADRIPAMNEYSLRIEWARTRALGLRNTEEVDLPAQGTDAADPVNKAYQKKEERSDLMDNPRQREGHDAYATPLRQGASPWLRDDSELPDEDFDRYGGAATRYPRRSRHRRWCLSLIHTKVYCTKPPSSACDHGDGQERDHNEYQRDVTRYGHLSTAITQRLTYLKKPLQYGQSALLLDRPCSLSSCVCQMINAKKILARINNAAKAVVKRLKGVVPRPPTQATATNSNQAASPATGAPPAYEAFCQRYENDVDPLPLYVCIAQEDVNNYLEVPAYDCGGSPNSSCSTLSLCFVGVERVRRRASLAFGFYCASLCTRSGSRARAPPSPVEEDDEARESKGKVRDYTAFPRPVPDIVVVLVCEEAYAYAKRFRPIPRPLLRLRLLLRKRHRYPRRRRPFPISFPFCVPVPIPVSISTSIAVLFRFRAEELQIPTRAKIAENIIHSLFERRLFPQTIAVYQHMLEDGLIPSPSTDALFLAVSLAASTAPGTIQLEGLKTILAYRSFTETHFMELLDHILILDIPAEASAHFTHLFITVKGEGYRPSRALVMKLVDLQTRAEDLFAAAETIAEYEFQPSMLEPAAEPEKDVPVHTFSASSGSSTRPTTSPTTRGAESRRKCRCPASALRGYDDSLVQRQGQHMAGGRVDHYPVVNMLRRTLQMQKSLTGMPWGAEWREDTVRRARHAMVPKDVPIFTWPQARKKK